MSKEMTTESRFSLGAQVGDTNAREALVQHYMFLRKALESTMSGSYSDDIVEFAPVLRIDGAIWHWDREGVDNLRVSKKKATATIDVFVPVSVWQGASASAIRRYLGHYLGVAFRMMGDRIRSKGLDCDVTRLERDIAMVIDKFMAQGE
jgi:hypothetical protein